MKRLSHKIRGMTGGELAFRAREYIDVLRERFLERPGSFGIDTVRDRALPPAPACPFPAFEDRDRTKALLERRFSDSIERVIAAADGICEHRIPVFSEIITFGPRIDWHMGARGKDPARLPFYRGIGTIESGIHDDIKVPWELNRHNFLIHLGKAYFVTGDRKYFDAWKGLIRSWIEDNPYNRGIHWESSLELSFRAINWIWSSFFFAAELRRDEALAQEMAVQLYLHGLHIRRHLSSYFSPNTHLTGEALGLLYLGTCHPYLKGAREWRATGAGILEAEVRRQVLDDGGYFEMAIYYHAYTVDFYLHYLLLRGADGGRETRARIRNAIRHLAYLSGPDGAVPLIGDSDGGRLLFLGGAKGNVRGACSTGAVLFGDGELKHLCRNSPEEETLWMLGPRGIEAFEQLRTAAPATHHSLNFDTGLFCFRSGMGESDSRVIIDCGRHGWGRCGHAHSDLLSIEWYAGGETVLADPGTYKYAGAGAMRDEYRGSLRHNTISVNDRSQSVPDGAFSWKTIARPTSVCARYLDEFGFFEGSHDAYRHLGCRLRRTVLFLGDRFCIVVDDVLLDRPIESLTWNMQFGEGALTPAGADGYRFEGAAGSHRVRFLTASEHDVRITEGAVYPDYGRAVAAPRLRYIERDVRRGHMIVTLLGPDDGLIDGFRLEGRNLHRRGGADGGPEIILERGGAGGADLPGGAGLPGGMESTGGAVSASFLMRNDGTALFVLRNGREVRDASGGLALRSDREHDLFMAVLSGGTLRVEAGASPRSLTLPFDAERVLIGGAPVSFTRKGDMIAFTGEPSREGEKRKES
jgi:hypothetical protein